jgi:arabinoxylan arabinofuranohydrolase
MKRLSFSLLAIFFLLSVQPGNAQSVKASKKGKNKYSAYLFAYFNGNAKKDESICFAISQDGYRYKALNNNQPIISSEKISSTGGVRDPHILRGADGKTFFMVATDMVSANGWSSNRAMVLLKSTDLINWSSSVVNIQTTYPDQETLERVWAPQSIYDSKAGKYMVYWAMKYSGGPDQIYYAYANKDFTALEGTPKVLFTSPGNKSCIDADLIEKDGKFHLFFKTEGNGNGIKQAISDNLTYGYVQQEKYLQQTTQAVEGSGVFQLNDGSGYIMMYDMYTSGKYQFTFSKDLQNFTVVDQEVAMDFHPRHGTVISLTEKEAAVLTAKWLSPEKVITSAKSPSIKSINTKVDSASSTVSFVAKPDADITNVVLSYDKIPGVCVAPAEAVNFSNGPVPITVSVGKKRKVYQASLKTYNNPVLDGLYADPEVLYSEKTGRFYIYPASDGFNGWSGNYFKVFSSPDLVNWTDSGKIIQLGTDVKWTDRNAWAPCIVEKKVNGQYKYFYYFTAAQKIGVAVADNPTGPFIDLGKPLIAAFPPGVKGGQQIDPDVFTDPNTGKSYLYWGNGYMAGAELNEDMVSIKENTLKVMTPTPDFREGAYVFIRNGKYYFLWSQNDTRDADYQVRYGTSESPLGDITIPGNNLVLIQNKELGIHGTGHNSVLQIPGKDEWYIVYHRFNYPRGITMGGAAGFNREVCIDKLEFDSEGQIKQVVPTHIGIQAVSLK